MCVYSRNSKVTDLAFSIPMYLPHSVVSGYYVESEKSIGLLASYFKT